MGCAGQQILLLKCHSLFHTAFRTEFSAEYTSFCAGRGLDSRKSTFSALGSCKPRGKTGACQTFSQPVEKLCGKVENPDISAASPKFVQCDEFFFFVPKGLTGIPSGHGGARLFCFLSKSDCVFPFCICTAAVFPCAASASCRQDLLRACFFQKCKYDRRK